ncbi:MAG: SDR family NAD(P)-dependent oxidoreductase [Rhodobacteraceae bacterium]|nr:SDR family NAD(P)-dependent oxidoreductase [Paracoccaceae bacterium]
MAFKNQTVAIVGGGSGIGKSMAAHLAEAGAKVILSSRNADKLTEAAKAIGGGEVLPLDMTDADSVAA